MKDLTDQVTESALDVADGVQQVISDTEEKIESRPSRRYGHPASGWGGRHGGLF